MTRNTILPNRVKIIRTDEGLRAWRSNKLIAYTDERDVAFLVMEGDDPIRLDYAENEREFRAVLEDFGVMM